ncbi:unnamed protein product [Pocillopora meandrina]|uniref:UMOD/GP2/OIT3-like D8C domain-containing protein n=1 Tax=Pocillopora meandrina TaxID=46732 RepID=A0AAU9XUN0_9CNID|nr:unnamed protein product [Pocillopora meandrina]
MCYLNDNCVSSNFKKDPENNEPYRLVGAAGTKIPKMRVPAYRCGADWSGWLDDAHTTVEDGKGKRKVCFSDRSDGCKYEIRISVKNCGSYLIYKLYPPACYSRYCGTD